MPLEVARDDGIVTYFRCRINLFYRCRLINVFLSFVYSYQITRNFSSLNFRVKWTETSNTQDNHRRLSCPCPRTRTR